MGPLITREHRDRVASYLDHATNEGATVHVDGRKDAATKSNGFFLGASLLDHVKPGMKCYDDEIFGPVLSVVRAEDLRRGAEAHQRQSLRQRHRHLHAERRRGAAVPVRCGGRHGRHQRAHPGAGRVLQLRRLEVARSSATCTCTGRRASSSTRAAKWSPAAGPIPAPARSTSASRRLDKSAGVFDDYSSTYVGCSCVLFAGVAIHLRSEQKLQKPAGEGSMPLLTSKGSPMDGNPRGVGRRYLYL